MTRSRAILFVVVLFILSGAVALAQIGNGFDLSWSTIDGGGGTSTGDSFALAGTVGQSDASDAMTGGTYTLQGGFWAGVPPKYDVYLPVTVRDP